MDMLKCFICGNEMAKPGMLEYLSLLTHGVHFVSWYLIMQPCYVLQISNRSRIDHNEFAGVDYHAAAAVGFPGTCKICALCDPTLQNQSEVDNE